MQRSTTLILTAIAGFVDTATFVGAHGLFAAHVTGNFVVFGAALAKGIEQQDYLKLIAFPVFMAFVFIGATLYGLAGRAKWPLSGFSCVILLQAILLFVVAALASLVPHFLTIDVLAMGIVAAMGLQNSLHRYMPGPMTTVMTGTVMNWSASLAETFFGLSKPDTKSPAVKPPTGWMMLCFAGGCVLAGFTTNSFGIPVILLPACLLVGCAIYNMKQPQRSAT